MFLPLWVVEPRVAMNIDLSLMQVFQLTGHLLYRGKVTAIYQLWKSFQKDSLTL
jgi:hypothetical protein